MRRHIIANKDLFPVCILDKTEGNFQGVYLLLTLSAFCCCRQDKATICLVPLSHLNSIKENLF